MTRVGVLGATGYTGIELVRLLRKHPRVKITYLSSQSFAGKDLREVYPHTRHEDKLQPVDLDKVAEACDLVFTALPAGVSYEIGTVLAQKGLKVIDLGADFRLDNPSVYAKWYNKEIRYSDNLRRIYGLTELYREEIRNAKVVGNPGCYPTSVLLGLAPLLKSDYWNGTVVIVDAKSGVSGAGRTSKTEYAFSEINEAVKPYKVVSHRHRPEMEQELSKLANRPVRVVFTPQLVPMTRGILSSIYLSEVNASLKELLNLYKDFYRDEYFVHVLPEGAYPSTKWVQGSNHVFISLVLDERTGTLVILSAIDNLVKGASGQAVQNMNVLFGFDEREGLDVEPIYP